RDPRASGEMLEAAVVAGLTSAGCDVLRVGVLPTPAIAYLVDALGADLGVVLSASHNPMPDNGVKLFAKGGHKLPDAVEDEIEARLGESFDRPTAAAIGRVTDVDALDRYVEHLIEASGVSLAGLRIVVDCGSTHLESLREAVVANGVDLGIAHDGDADRCLAVDATGAVVDGDQIMAVLALAMKEQGVLSGDTLVTTVMSNLGLHLAMREHGVTMRTTAVGDRYVVEELRAGGFT